MKIEISGVHLDIDTKLKKYATKKIDALERYIPRRVRESVRAETLLKADKKGGAKYTAEIILHLPADRLMVRESTLNIYAAIDIAEAKLKNQLKRYKDKHGNPRLYRRVIGKFRRSPEA